MLSPVALKLLQYYPLPNRAGHRRQLPGSRAEHGRTSTSCWSASIRTSATTSACPSVTTGTTATTATLRRGHSDHGASPAAREQELRCSRTRTRCGRTCYNDFRIGYHRIDFDTLNYFCGERPDRRRRGARHSRASTATSSTTIPASRASTSATSAGSAPAGTNWFQFDTTFQLSNVLSYTAGKHNIRAGFDLRRLATGRRAANDAARALHVHRRHDRLLGGRLHAGPAAHGDHACRPDAGARRRLAERVLHQRRLAGDAEHDAEPGPALRAEHARADLRRATRRCSTRTSRRSSRPRFPSPGFKFHEPNYTDIAPRLGATYRLTEKTVLRAGLGIYYNPNQMNTFTFLTNNPPLAAVYHVHIDPAQPDAVVRATRPASSGRPGRPNMISPNRDLPNARKNQWSFDIQQRALAGPRRWRSSTSARTPATWIAASINNTPQPGPGAVDPRRPNQNFREHPHHPERPDRRLRCGQRSSCAGA